MAEESNLSNKYPGIEEAQYRSVAIEEESSAR
jgi:hypothetical protein